MNIYGAFFIFDEGNIVMLFNGFQKKTQKTPESEIEKAVKLKNEYYALRALSPVRVSSPEFTSKPSETWTEPKLA